MKAKLGIICLLLVLLYCVSAVSAVDCDSASPKIPGDPNPPLPQKFVSIQDMKLGGLQSESISPYDGTVIIDNDPTPEGPYA